MRTAFKFCIFDIAQHRKAAGIYKRLKETRQGVSKAHDVEPTVGKVWEMLYVFERDGEQIPAILGDMSPFYMTLDGDMDACLADGWTLMNDAGIELEPDQAWRINRIIKDHHPGQDSKPDLFEELFGRQPTPEGCSRRKR